MSKTAIYPGTFDPITFGHIDVIKKSLKLFDKVVVAVSDGENKDYLFDHNDIDLFYVAIARIDSKWIYHKISNLNIEDKMFYTREAYLNADKLKAEVLEYLWEKSKNELMKLFFVFYFCNKINKIPTSGINQIYENLNKMIKISYDKNLSELLSMMGINNVNDVLEIFIQKILCNDGLIGTTFEDYHQHMKRTYEIFLKNFLLDIQDYRGEDIRCKSRNATFDAATEVLPER